MKKKYDPTIALDEATMRAFREGGVHWVPDPRRAGKWVGVDEILRDALRSLEAVASAMGRNPQIYKLSLRKAVLAAYAGASTAEKIASADAQKLWAAFVETCTPPVEEKKCKLPPPDELMRRLNEFDSVPLSKVVKKRATKKSRPKVAASGRR